MKNLLKNYLAQQDTLFKSSIDVHIRVFHTNHKIDYVSVYTINNHTRAMPQVNIGRSLLCTSQLELNQIIPGSAEFR